MRRRSAEEGRLTRGQQEIAREAAKAGSQLIKDKLFEKRPYLKFAFANPYNLSLFLGAIAAAGITLNPVLALAALGAEAIWLLYAPDSKRLRKILWDPRFDRAPGEDRSRGAADSNDEPPAAPEGPCRRARRDILKREK